MDSHPAFDWLLESAHRAGQNVWISDDPLPPYNDWPLTESFDAETRYVPAGHGPCFFIHEEVGEDLWQLKVFYPIRAGRNEDIGSRYGEEIEVDGNDELIPIPAVAACDFLVAHTPPDGRTMAYPLAFSSGYSMSAVSLAIDLTLGIEVDIPLIESALLKLSRGEAEAGEVTDISLMQIRGGIDLAQERADFFRRMRDDMLYQLLLGVTSEEDRDRQVQMASEITGLSTEEIEDARDRSYERRYAD